MPAASHISEVMRAIRDRVQTLDTRFPNLRVEVTNPARLFPIAVDTTALVTLFVYRIEPDKVTMLATPTRGKAVRLQVLITAFTQESQTEGGSPNYEDLDILANIIRLFTERPVLGPIPVPDRLPLGRTANFAMPGIEITANQISPQMEEINHIWGTQGADAQFRTSIVYDFHTAVIAPRQYDEEGPPIFHTVIGPDSGVGDIDPAVENAVPAALATPTGGGIFWRVYTAAEIRLRTQQAVAAAAGDVQLSFHALTYIPKNYGVILQQFDPDLRQWVELTRGDGPFASLGLRALAQSLPAGHAINFPNPNEAAVLRLRAQDPLAELEDALLTIEPAP